MMLDLKRTILTVFLLVAMSSTVMSANIWYEDNNLGEPGGMMQDFKEKFQKPETFSQATRYINVYMVRPTNLSDLDDLFITKYLLPYLTNNNIKLAINAGGATWMKRKNRGKVFDSEMTLLKRLKGLGVEVGYISLQSVLSKPLKTDGQKDSYPLSDRIDDVIAYTKAACAVYPQVQIGIIDALPSHAEEYREPYRLLRDAMTKESIPLSYIHLDMPFELPKEQRDGITWQKIREVERYVEETLGLKFGLITTSAKGGKMSSKAFHERVMAALDCYAGADGSPAEFIIASWFPYPQKAIPETASGSDYPAMRTVLEFGRELKRIENGGALVDASQAGWRALCTTP